MREMVLELLARQGVTGRIEDTTPLFEAGLTPFGALQLMLALEAHCGIEFPDHMVSRRAKLARQSVLHMGPPAAAIADDDERASRKLHPQPFPRVPAQHDLGDGFHRAARGLRAIVIHKGPELPSEVA